MKKFAILGALLIVLGGILFVGALAASGWDIALLSTNGPLEERLLDVENRQQDITLSERDTPVVIGLSDDNQIHLQYAESRRQYYTITDDDMLTIKKEVKPLAFVFNFDFNFNAKFTLLLPKNFQGNVTIKNANGTITLSNLDLQELLLKTSNGRVELENVTAKSLELKSSNAPLELNHVKVQDSIICDTSNGKLALSDIIARNLDAETSNATINADSIHVDDALSLESSNGRIDVDALAGKEISLTTSNASITGSITGSLHDFSVESKTSNASNNLPEDMTGGEKDLRVHTSNGAIKLQFEESNAKPETKVEPETAKKEEVPFSVRE